MFKRILVPLDGSELVEKALPYAEALAQRFDAELIALRVLLMIPEAIGGRHGMMFQERPTRDRPEVLVYLNGVMSQWRERHLLPARAVVLENYSAGDAIIDLACQEKVDLIVMSTHGRSGLSRLVYGSVAGKVLQHAPCPVFLVKVTEADCGPKD
jgi:nucleotide-binding universal stress UspA family protein